MESLFKNHSLNTDFFFSFLCCKDRTDHQQYEFGFIFTDRHGACRKVVWSNRFNTGNSTSLNVT